MKYDYAVVGGGPAGCFAALGAAARGDTILFEEHKKQPVHCAGLISSSGFKRLGVRPGHFVLNELKGARIYSPLGSVLEVRSKSVKAYAVDRSLFDGYLLDMTLSSGVSLENVRIESITNSCLTSGAKQFKAGRKIIATGVDYNLHRRLGINQPREFLVGAQYEMDVECDEDMVELHFTVPDFFAWVIPLKGRARVGLCTKGNPTPHLDSFIKHLKHEKRIRSSRILNKSYGIIPVFNPRMKTQYSDVSLVGDAAGQVKATSGGGVVMGCTAAKHAWSSDYERQWRKDIERELKLHLAAYRFINKLSPKNLDCFFRITSRSKSVLEEHGDMDYASKTALALARNPKFALRFLFNTPSFLMDFL